MSTSIEQVARLLALVPYLQAHPDVDLDATAEAFGVTPRRLLADLEVLWFVGLPGGLPGDLIDIDMDAVQEQGRIRLSNAEYLARPMRFTIEEVTSLIVALRAVREVTGGAGGRAQDDGVGAARAGQLRSRVEQCPAQVAVVVGPARAAWENPWCHPTSMCTVSTVSHGTATGGVR